MKPGRENKPHIGIYGRCNTGKSSLLNSIVGYDCSIVAPRSGTTTDIVKVGYEIAGFSPVIFIDTAGIDDNSEIGSLRVNRTLASMEIIDLALIIYNEWGKEEESLCQKIEKLSIPYILIRNQKENTSTDKEYGKEFISVDTLYFTDSDKEAILDKIKSVLPEPCFAKKRMFGNLIAENDLVMLVCPIDSEAPAGRLILPQVQPLRELLNNYAISIIVQPEQISEVLKKGIVPKLIITDSQLFGKIEKLVPNTIELTSFSILLAKMKGDYPAHVEGLRKIDSLNRGDKILIMENCRHQTTCEDIGRVKIPSLIKKYHNGNFKFHFITGLEELPENLGEYSLALQCGGCMVTARQIRNRINKLKESGVAVTNYGMCLKYLSGKINSEK